jgi:hypothetical protein
MTEQTCDRCAEPIKEEAQECPHCGNNPRHDAFVARGVFILIGIVVAYFFPVVGVVVIALGILFLAAMAIEDFSPAERS